MVNSERRRIAKPILEFLGYPMLDILPKKYHEVVRPTFNDILLLDNQIFIVGEQSVPSITKSPLYSDKTYEELTQYGHLYSRSFKGVTVKDYDRTHITELMCKAMDLMPMEPSESIAIIQGLMLLSSVYSSYNAPIVTHRLKKKGVVPYEL